MKTKKSELEISRKNEIIMGIQVVEARERLDAIAQIIENVDNRCMAADGPVTQTLKEMTQEEIKEIYELAKQHVKAKKPLQVFVSRLMYPNDPADKPISSSTKWHVHLKKGVQHFRLDYSGTKQECEWMAHMLRLALASGDAGTTNAMLQDAGTMIRRLVHRIVKDNPALPRPAIIAQANGWLQRKGLQGSILREDK